MDFRLSRHAEWEMSRRAIPLTLVQAVMLIFDTTNAEVI